MDGNRLISRDFLSLKVWDLRNNKNVFSVVPVFLPLKSKLYQAYENDYFYHKFGIGVAPDNKRIITGMFDKKFHVIDYLNNNNIQFDIDFEQKTKARMI